MKKNYNIGFVAPEIITSDQHILGASGIDLPVIKPDGDWRKYVPSFESQLQKSFDSFGCTVEGTINAIQTLENFLLGKANDYSKRFTYNEAEVKPPGDDPHRIATHIRGSGLLDEIYLQEEADSLAEYMTPRPLPVELRIKGQKWLNTRQLGHKWLWTSQPDQKTRIALIKDALTKGTVCVSVVAWYKNENGLYYSPQGLPNGHWTQVSYVDDTGIYVADSYNDANDPSSLNLKKLTLDHDIQFAKVYFFTTPTQQQNWFVSIIISLLEIVGLRQKQLVEAVKPPVVPEPILAPKSLIEPFCKAIEKFEGAKPFRNNPGNIKGVDGKFLIFSSYKQGFTYLRDYVTRASTGKHLKYKPEMTIDQFFHIYTGDPEPVPTNYAKFVAGKCEIPVTFKIRDLI